ncbi:MAG: amidohydrolase [Anaerolineae bacterium]|nr:MAG: amidohydrolase [Anaerolineae bacterium]
MPERADLLISGGAVLTMDTRRAVLRDGAVAIAGRHIVAVGPTQALQEQIVAKRTIDATGCVVMPGLINAHTHLAMNLQRGLSTSVPDAIYRIMWPIERALTGKDCYTGALLGAAEALKAGTTTVNDHYFFMEDIARATMEVGIRAVLGHTIMTRHGPFVGQTEFDKGVAFVQRWQGSHPLVHPALAPHAPDTVSPEWLCKLRVLATELGVRLHLHLAQSQHEVETIYAEQGTGTVDHLHRLGILGPDVIAAHCIYVSDREVNLLAESGTHAVYCPRTHALCGRSLRAVAAMAQGVNVVLGDDYSGCDFGFDLFAEMQAAAMVQREMSINSQALLAKKLLEMVTVDAARALGLEGQIGALEPGYLADVVVLELGQLHTTPAFDVANTVVFGCSGRDVHTVLVDGQIVVEAGRLTRVDETALVEGTRATSAALLDRALASDDELRQRLNIN